MEGLFAGLIFVTVALTAFAIGVLTSIRSLRDAVTSYGFLLIVILNAVVVPSIGWVVTRLVPLEDGVALGILLCAICAAGPVALKASQIARADLSWSLSVTVVLLVLNAATLPLWSALLVGEALSLRTSDLVGVLVAAIILPVLIGLIVQRWAGNRARTLSNLATQISNVTLVLAVIVGLAANVDILVESLSVWAMLATVLILAIAAVMGWYASRSLDQRRSSSLVTLNRATSVALLVVGRAFSEAGEIFAAVVVFGLVQTVAALLLSLYWRRSRSRVLAA